MLESVAMLTMLIDHIGVAFYPDILLLRVIGRLAMPLYTYGIVRGFHHTRSRGRYALRLLVIACVSQPFWEVFYPGQLNMVFAFLAGLLTLWALEAAPVWADHLPGLAGKAGKVLFRLLILVIAVLCFTTIEMSYSLYGLALLLLYYYTHSWHLLLLGHFVLNIIALPSLGPIQLFSILGTVLIILPFDYPRLVVGRWLYRVFYPAHLALLVALLPVR